MSFRSATLLVVVVLGASTPVRGQQDVSASASVAGIAQFNANLDDGGRVNWGGGLARASLTRQFTSQLSAGLAIRYDYQSWNFNQPAAFGGSAPWTNLNLPNVGLDVTYAVAPDLFLAVGPSVEWAFENGARTSDALTYGATASLAKAFSRDLLLGVGVGVFRRIDQTQALPYVVVDWKINDRWRVANPFQAGPAGGAGIEVVYAPNERWEIAEGVTYRSYRFRLSESNPTPSGIGENSFIPLFLRISRNLSPELRIDFYGALTTAGKVSVDNADGAGRFSDNYKIGPALGATLVYRR
jgi:hypothetical protein